MNAGRALAQRCRTSASSSAIWSCLGPARWMWRAGEGIVAAITRPSDSVWADRAAERVMADSRTGHALTSGLDLVEAAWPQSIPGRAWRSAGTALDSTVTRVRAVAALVVIAMGTALVLGLAAARPSPLSWIVPAAAAVGGLVVLAVARPLAAALTRERS